MSREFEDRVQQMLQRRSLDISEASLNDRTGPSQAGRRFDATPGLERVEANRWQEKRTPPIWTRAAAAVLIAIAVVGVGAWSTRQGADPAEVELAVATTSTERGADALPDTTASAQPAPGSVAPGLDATPADLPSSVDLLEGPLVFSAGWDMDAPSVAAAYLERRLPEVTATIEQVDEIDELTVFRWQDDVQTEASGYIVVRIRQFEVGVVASFNSRVDSSNVERRIDGVEGPITNRGAAGFVVEVVPIQDARQSPLASATTEALTGPASADLVVSIDGRLDLDQIAPPTVLNLRIVEAGDKPTSITEFAVGVVGFPQACGTEPPIAIEVGDLLQPLEAEPERILANQLRWVHQGDRATLEIRWPADPVLATRFLLPLDDSALGSIVQRATNTGEPNSEAVVNSVALILNNDPADPCSIVQVNVSGPEQLSDAWSGALSAQWSLGFDLNVAEVQLELDPPSDEITELVAGTTTAAAPPSVPVGSCDGLPNDPPRTGAGNNTTHTTPEEALADFVENQPSLDPPLPTTGYDELIIDDGTVSYVYSPAQPIVVVNIASNGTNWQVTNWQASPC